MKKYFAKAFLGLCALGTSTVAFAQEAAEAAQPAVESGMHQALKTKFIEGGADFMSLVAIALIFGLAFCLERIIYLNLAETNPSKLLKGIEEALDRGDVEAAKTIARDTRGPIASIAYQGLMRIDQGVDIVEKSIVSYGGVQGGLFVYLEDLYLLVITQFFMIHKGTFMVVSDTSGAWNISYFIIECDFFLTIL